MNPETTAVARQSRRIRIPVWAFLIAVAVIITGLLLILHHQKNSLIVSGVKDYSITVPAGIRPTS